MLYLIKNNIKMFVFIILLFAVSTKICAQKNVSNKYRYYKKAIKYVEKDEKFLQFTDKKGVTISEEILPAYHFQRYFTKEMNLNFVQLNIESSKRNLIDDIVKDVRVTELSTHPDSEFTLFFTIIENDYLLFEIYQDTKKTRGYFGQSIFGTSLVYLAIFNDSGKLVNLHSKRVSHN